MKILIFENSKAIAERLIDLISETIENVKFYKASSYAEALYFLDDYKPDAVLLDLKFPGDAGIDLLKKIKASTDETVVIALLSEIDESGLKQCQKYEADFVFDKYKEFERIPEIIGTIR